MDHTALLAQMKEWHEKDEYKKIIEAVEAVAEEDRNYELTGQLARAYNNRGEDGDYDRAVSLLLSTEEEGKEDPNWHFRMGYSKYYLDREWEALPEFERVLELTPEDEDAKEMAGRCYRQLVCPMATESFSQRVERFWKCFAEKEGELRGLMDQRQDEDKMRQAADLAHELLHVAFSEIYFEMGFNGEKYELILTAEGMKHRLFKLEYWKRQAPGKLSADWNFIIGRQPALALNQFELQMHGIRIGCKDVTVWPEPLEDGQAGIEVYSEKLLPLLEEKENAAYNLVEILLDQSIGEVSSILHIGWLDLLKEPKKEVGMSLDRLAGYIQEQIDPDPAPENLCERYMGYQMEPKDLTQEWELREDVFVGNTACPQLINSYFQEDDSIVNEHQADGVVMGFLFYNNDAVEQSLMVPFRGEIEDEIMDQAEGIVDIIGGATGRVFSYIDVICYDLKAFLDIAGKVMNKRDLEEIGFHVFRKGIRGVNLKESTEK